MANRRALSSCQISRRVSMKAGLSGCPAAGVAEGDGAAARRSTPQMASTETRNATPHTQALTITRRTGS